MKSNELIDFFNNSHITSFDMTIGDADEVLQYDAIYKVDEETFNLKYEEICKLRKLNENWPHLNLDDFKELLFFVRL